MSELLIACTLSSTEFQERRTTLLPGLIARASARLPVPDGYSWHFTPTKDLLPAITQVIDAERGCCAFLRFAVTVEPAGGPIKLEVTGPPGTREFLDQLVTVAAA
jgi:hypothetical protein